MNGNNRADIKPGIHVSIKGIVKDILTNSQTHPHGIKVRLTSGEIGRVKEIFQI